MRTVLITITILGLSVLTGCNGRSSSRNLLSVDFQENQTLRYRFVSERVIGINWKPQENLTGECQTCEPRTDIMRELEKTYETVDMIIAYEPVEVDPYGLTTIRATCESIKLERHLSKKRDAAKSDAAKTFAGKSFVFTVGPTGKIKDYSQLDKLIKEAGKKAFRADTTHGRIKELDMISDFSATQWFLWDSISSIERPIEGISVGQSWKSQLSVPSPMVMKKARDVTYTLEEIRESEQGRLAVIHSSYLPAKSAPKSWPMPYSGRFQMSGKFGFLGNYRLLELNGQGEELFNIDKGRTEQYNQQYLLLLDASVPMGLGKNPQIIIKQDLTMELLED